MENTIDDLQFDYKQRRKKDETDEKIVAEYLDAYFYPTFSTTLARCTDKELQIAGLDITVEDENWNILTIDEKAATRYAGKELQTFAHEVSSINTAGYEYDGWLLDFHSASDYLVEVWIDEVTTSNNVLYNYSDIKSATVILVKKKDVWSYLKGNKVSSRELKKLGKKMRRYGWRSYFYNNFIVTCQQGRKEMAVNILIPREVLVNQLATYAVNITNGEVITIKNDL